MVSGNGLVVKEKKNTTCIRRQRKKKGNLRVFFSHTTIKLGNKGIWSAAMQQY